MVHTAARLRQEGVTVALLDLTGIGQNLSPEQWYGGLPRLLGHKLDPSGALEDELDDFWFSQDRLCPIQRWLTALRELVLPRLVESSELRVETAVGPGSQPSTPAL